MTDDTTPARRDLVADILTHNIPQPEYHTYEKAVLVDSLTVLARRNSPEASALTRLITNELQRISPIYMPLLFSGEPGITPNNDILTVATAIAEDKPEQHALF